MLLHLESSIGNVSDALALYVVRCAYAASVAQYVSALSRCNDPGRGATKAVLDLSETNSLNALKLSLTLGIIILMPGLS